MKQNIKKKQEKAHHIKKKSYICNQLTSTYKFIIMKHFRLLTLAVFSLFVGLTANAQRDVTSLYITNATLSGGTDGWTTSFVKSDNPNAPADAFSNSVRGNNTEGWASEAYAGWDNLYQTAFSMKQSITLPKGNYTLVNYSFFRQGDANDDEHNNKSLAYLRAGENNILLKTLRSIPAAGYANSQSEGANVFDSKMYRNTIDFTIDENNTTIEIGVDGIFDEARSWCIVGQFELINNDLPASLEAPFDVTGYITNPGFEYRDMTGWTMSPEGHFGTQSNNQGFKVGGWYAEKWQASGALPEGSMSQTLTNLPQGYYKLTANLGGNGTYVSLNDQTANWTADKDYELICIIGEGEPLTITAGKTAEGTANWVHFDNFKLYFCGEPTISVVAKDFTSGDQAQADTWYAVQIPTNGEYSIEAGSSLSNVVYTVDGTIVLSQANNVNDQFTSPMTLTAGTYYFKSSSAQTLAFSPLSYTYTLGEPSLNIKDGDYVNTLSTWEITYNPFTDNPNATFALLGSAKAALKKGETLVAEGALTLDGNKLTATFSDVQLENAAVYTLTLPAGAIGFEGQAENEEIAISFNTPLIADGLYYLYDSNAELFLGRGGAWGTEAVLNKYGVPFNWKNGADGAGSIEFIDWPGVYLFITGTGVFTDNASTGWKFEETSNGYKLLKADGTVYATHELGGLGEYVHTTEDASLATVWTLVQPEIRDAIVDAYPALNKASVMTAAGKSGEDLDAFVSSMSGIDMTNKIGTATFSGNVGDWTFSEVRNQGGQPAYGNNFCEAWNATGSWSQTVSDLRKGIYKLTVNGFERRTNNGASYSLGEQGYNLVSTYMAANGEQVRFANWFDEVERNGNNYNPNSTGEAIAKFADGKYLNELYVYVGDDGKLDITINKSNYVWDCWVLFNNFTLTYYQPTDVEVEITDAGWATLYYGELNLAIPDKVKAYIVSGITGNTISLAEVPNIPAGTGVILEGPTGKYNFDIIEEARAVGENILKGTDERTEIQEAGHKYYMLSTGKAGVGFYYQVTDGNGITNQAHKAYIDVDANQSLAGYYLLFNEADGISNATIATENGNEVYTLSGMRVNGKLAKGVYIMNGKKVVIK